MKKSAALSVAFVALTIIMLMFIVRPIKAASFIANDAATLIAAINAANDEATNPGPDTIDLQDNVVLVLPIDENDPDGMTALPTITSTITIQGNDWVIERDTNINPTFRLFEVKSPGDLTLDHVTLRGALNHGISACGRTDCGGALVNFGGTVTVVASVFKDNEGSWGAAIYNDFGSTLTISDSLFIDNYASASGGGIQNEGTLTITDTVISHNSAYGTGGGLLNAGILNMSNSTVSDNTAGQDGGGIYNQNPFTNGQATITGSSITGNLAGTTTGYGSGGGVYNFSDASMGITDSVISYNTTVSFAMGGGVLNVGTLTLTNVTLEHNISDSEDDSGEGGGLLNYGNLTINDSFLTQNTTDGIGSALRSTTGAVIHNSCIAGNRRDVTSVSNSASTSLDATGNWWGAASGPSGTASGKGDSVSSNVNFGSYSSSQFAHCVGAPRLSSPANGSLTNNQPLLTWSPVARATQYQIDFNGAVTTISQPGYTPVYPLLLGTYTWRVRAGTATNWGNWSEARFFNLVSAPNAAPSPNYYTTATPTIVLTWNRIPGAITYNLEVSKSKTFVGTPIYSATVSTLYDTLTPATLGEGTYYWRVQVSGVSGTWSGIQSFVIGLP